MAAKVVEIPGVGNVEFPDSMSDEQISAASAKLHAESKPPAFKRFEQSLTQGVDLMEQAKNLLVAVQQPKEAILSALTAQDVARVRAKQAFDAGDYPSAIRHSINYLMPMLGIQSESAGEKLAQGQIAEGLGETAAMGVNLALPVGMGKIRTTGMTVAPRFVNPNPAERAAFGYLEQQGVPVPAGTQTGSKFVKAAQKANAYTPLGAPIAEASERQMTEGLRRTSQGLAQDVHPVPVTAEQVGADLRESLAKSVEQQAAAADQQYAIFRKAEADPKNLRTIQTGTKTEQTGVLDASGQPVTRQVPITQDVALPVDVRSIKAQLQPIYDHMKQWWEPAKRSASSGYQAIESILKGPDYVPASVAETGLGGLKELAREGEGRNAGLAKHMIPKLQKLVDDAAGQAGPEVVQALQDARGTTARQYATKEVFDQVRTEPVQAFKQLIYSGDAGIGRLRQIVSQGAQELPSKIGRAFLEDVFGKARAEGGFGRTQGIWNDWQNLGPETKKLLFNPKQVEDLNNFFLGAKKIAENPNPSGSALVGSIPALGLMVLNHPITGTSYVLGSGAVAKMLYSPRGVSLLTKGMRIPASGSIGKSAAAANLAAQILAMAGSDVQRLKEQPSQ